MKDTPRQIIVFVITLLILIALFWFVLPMLGLRDLMGGLLYLVFVLVASFLLSGFISKYISRLIK